MKHFDLKEKTMKKLPTGVVVLEILNIICISYSVNSGLACLTKI